MLSLCLLIRRNRRRSRVSPEGTNTGTSSFWNRSTTLFSIRRDDTRRQTPIWTGWEFVEAEADSQGSRGSRNGGHESPPHSPGEGSPRGSGEEADPFLTRRSVRSATLADETQTKSDTLVSMPAAAVLGSGTPRSSPPQGGHIIPRDVLARMAESEQEESSPYSIRIVHPSPPQDQSPLLPPPPLDPDGLAGLGVRNQARPISDRSVGSQKTQDQSMYSEKSGASLETDPAELLVAQRVKVGATPSHSRLATIESASEPSRSSSALGLSGLSSRLGRLSWFRRMSSSGPSTSPSDTRQDTAADSYTRTPPRASRNGSPRHSRRGSVSGSTRLLDDADLEAGPVSPTQRPPRRNSGLGLGLLAAGDRPMSSVSAKSTVSASGNTVYHSARSRPASSVVDFPMPVTAPDAQERLSHAPAGSDAAFAGPPPAYAVVDDNSSNHASNGSNGNSDRAIPPSRVERPPSEIDILDIPAPGPASPFISARPAFPPGLIPLPQQWRDSYTTDGSSPTSAGVAIDILDDTPPTALEGWRDLSGAGERRQTFGVVSMPWSVGPSPKANPSAFQPPAVQQADPATSHHASLHSLPSHLRVPSSRSATDSAPSSQHSQGGSASSRPSQRSQLRDVSTFSEESEESRHDVPPLRSPPLSAVRGSFASMQGASRRVSTRRLSQQPSQHLAADPPSLQALPVQGPPPAYMAPLLGTINSATSDTHSSVTTAMTDPITGAIMHFPSLPYARGQQTDARRESRSEESGTEEEHW
ncbi:uncharacterized protein PHACADRAFT_251785 [Phanerochaete carnosa HHB-10118-sp]|uniref:Uncharacterized protein n=1 Tax=Phanerochaete carnosa (strain HHB-10118-sp) TaxID=650164 RepID=K5W224_PHACS|nr:uncharacterized protein PHACADRAFT_251785 [Phanerochaete carnosa HHB-10118-sp]EKM57888.1 hypothetical protein PHACADRAFT_251785 [Phanerochaete carnosa HHB-10118-sp]